MESLIGTVVGDRYRIVEQIGAGGMALVFRGEHQLLRKGVAVKVLLPEVAVDADMAARFEAEAVAAARLDHPNCVGISDFGRTSGGQLYLVMELIDGKPMSNILVDNARLPWERSVEIVRQVLRGLARAHELGIVHRDLKPSNIMLIARPGGWEIAKIIDFGISKMISESPVGPRVETRAGTVFGTADFIAPERLLGATKDDPRSDLYSVGVMLYEMITGIRPFHAEDALTIVQRAVSEIPKPPSVAAPDVRCPRRLEEAILRALEKDPALRYQSARDFLAALDVDELRTAANPVIAAATAALADDREARSYRRRRRALWYIAAGGGALIVLLALVFSWAGSGSASPARAGAGASTPGGPDAAPGPSPELAAEVDRLVKQAGEGDTLESRQSAADRLVALGFGDRVPRAQKLARDLHQKPTCAERLSVLGGLEKLKDPSTLVSLRAAMARPDNDCLQDRLHVLVAQLEKSSTPKASEPPPPTKKDVIPTTRKTGTSTKKPGRGGHF